MASVPYLNPSPTSPFLELSGDHDHQYHHLSFNNLEPQTSFSSSSLSNPLFLTPAQVQQPSDDHNISIEVPQKFQFQLLQGADHIVSCGGSCDDQYQTLDQNEGDQSGALIRLSIFKNGSAERNYDENQSSEINSTSSVKWMSSKMRIMRKLTSPDQTFSSTSITAGHAPMNSISSSHKLEDDQQKLHPSSPPPLGTDHSSSNHSSNNMMNPIRVCSDCNTTKTPLWRSGPRGPKTLCNACGIRQRKARRAMAAAAAAANDTTLAAEARPTIKSIKVKQKDSKSRIKGCSSNNTVPFKKRRELTSPPSSQGRPKKQLCFEDFTIMMNDTNSGSATVQRVFPQDEKEAAILLMALSCGLVHG